MGQRHKSILFLALSTLFLFSFASSRVDDATPLKVGTGIWDITVGMMGYAMMGQSTAGLHFRLRARAFIFEDSAGKRIVFVSTDSCMIFTGVKLKVVQLLQQLYGSLYSADNVMLSGTHTHAGPAGYAYYALYDIMSLGFHRENFDTIVQGIVHAISVAHENIEKNGFGKVLMTQGTLLDSNINRSPSAYLANPSAERARYPYNVDKEMTVLRLINNVGKEIGMINWFAVHGTSMNNTNYLISGDNKGYASYLFEKLKNGNESVPGMGPFVAAFAQRYSCGFVTKVSNEGDVSPNTRGAFCDNGLPCDFAHSTCGGTSQGCHGYGPGKTDFESTKMIGFNQFNKALELYESADVPLTGPIQYVHTYVDMTKVHVAPQWTHSHLEEVTCVGALGDSFAAGTTDGPGDFDFQQGTNSSETNAYWNFIASFLSDPSPAQIKCQYPKPILLNTGDITWPLPWTPSILPLQMFRIGQLVLVGVPGEFTTMSGRRLRETVKATLIAEGAADNSTVIVIAGLANAYSHYITTFEEFGIQRYEGASTLYGPHTLAAYQQEYSKLAVAMAHHQIVPPGPSPPDLENQTFSFQPGVLFDEGDFGKIYSDVKASYHRNETARVTFYGANPRNNFRTQNTFLTVERFDGTHWSVLLRDGDWDAKFHWESHLLAESLVTIEWDIAPTTLPGTYRIRTFGTSKSPFGNLSEYEGTSSSFQVQ